VKLGTKINTRECLEYIKSRCQRVSSIFAKFFQLKDHFLYHEFMFATPISQLISFSTCQCATLGHHIRIFKFNKTPYSHRIKVRYKYLVLPLLVPKMIDLKVSKASSLVGSDRQRHQINQGSYMQVIQNLYHSISFALFLKLVVIIFGLN
jgi:hypothetical protein